MLAFLLPSHACPRAFWLSIMFWDFRSNKSCHILFGCGGLQQAWYAVIPAAAFHTLLLCWPVEHHATTTQKSTAAIFKTCHWCSTHYNHLDKCKSSIGLRYGILHFCWWHYFTFYASYVISSVWKCEFLPPYNYPAFLLFLHTTGIAVVWQCGISENPTLTAASNLIL